MEFADFTRIVTATLGGVSIAVVLVSAWHLLNTNPVRATRLLFSAIAIGLVSLRFASVEVFDWELSPEWGRFGIMMLFGHIAWESRDAAVGISNAWNRLKNND